MLKNIRFLVVVFLASLFSFQTPTADAGPTIRQAILGHLSMSISRCQRIAKDVCESKSNMCTNNEGTVIFDEDYTLGIQCSKLGRDVTIMIIFGAVVDGKNADGFNEMLMSMYNEAYPYFE